MQWLNTGPSTSLPDLPKLNASDSFRHINFVKSLDFAPVDRETLRFNGFISIQFHPTRSTIDEKIYIRRQKKAPHGGSLTAALGR